MSGPAGGSAVDEQALIAEYEAERPARTLSGTPLLVVQVLGVVLTLLALWWVFQPIARQLYLPLFLVGQWLMLSALLHVLLRLLGRRSDLDQILNITGLAALIVGAFLVVWDWVWIVAGWHNEVLLGLSHMVLVIWGLAITVLGLKRILDVPVWLGVVLNVVWVAVGWPLSATVMRSPV